MNKEELNRLLEKYYNGTSTESEEGLLREFFTGSDVPDGYEAEKAMFTYYSEQMVVPEPSADFEDRIINEIGKQEIPGRIRTLFYIGVAATILIITGVWFFFQSQRSQADTFKDPQIAYAETMKILYSVSRQMNQMEDKLDPVRKINEIPGAGLGKIEKSTIIIEDNLRSLNYMQKAIDISKTAQENK
jgi:hypothetical protein